MRRTSAVSGPDAVRNAVRFGRDPLSFLDELRGRSDLVTARFGVGPILSFVVDPELVQRVLVDDHSRYQRPDIISSRTQALTDNGLIQSDGQLWRQERSRLNPLFGGDRLTQYADRTETVADDVIGEWRDGETLDLYHEMTEITARVIAQELLGVSLTPADIELIKRTSDAIAREFTISPSTLLRQFLPTPPSSDYRDAITEMHDWAEDTIEQQRGQEGSPENLITRLLMAERQPNVDLPENLIRDEVLTFLFAGYETTALTLSFALWFVSREQSIADRLRAEAERVPDDASPRDILSRLEYAELVVRETLRLRPASWAIFREARVESGLGDTRIRRGDFLLLPQWTLHRDPRFFTAPETFDPDRWVDQDPNDVPAYFPFGAGPQSCIGGRLAMAEAKLVLSRVLREFDIETTSRSIDDLRPAGVLLPQNGVPATVRRAD